MLRAIRTGLEEKFNVPNIALSPTLPEAADAIDEIDMAINQAVAAIAAVIDAHNLRNSRFTAEQDEARKELKGHHLREGHERYLALRDAAMSAERQRDIRARQSEVLRGRVTNVRDKLRSHGPAIETINSLLKSPRPWRVGACDRR
jgi:hypothetical protein